ncbi:MAG: DUF1569 domain-containing protein [Bacteroidota bacterium]
MTRPNVFTPEVAKQLTERINAIAPTTTPQWGKMNAAQMLAHCCVTYEMAYTDKHPKPNFFVRLLIGAFAKSTVVGDKPYKRNGQTAPAFLVVDERDFEKEKKRLIDYINYTAELGEDHFDGKESLSFGRLTKNQWNNMFYKHLEHHLTQFGV